MRDGDTGTGRKKRHDDSRVSIGKLRGGCTGAVGAALGCCAKQPTSLQAASQGEECGIASASGGAAGWLPQGPRRATVIVPIATWRWGRLLVPPITRPCACARACEVRHAACDDVRA